MTSVTLDQARSAKRNAERLFSRLGNVVGLGITRIGGEYAIKVNLSEPMSPQVVVPKEVDGVRLRIEVVGTLRPR